MRDSEAYNAGSDQHSCDYCKQETQTDQKSDLNRQKTSGCKTVVRKRQKSESSSSAAVEVAKSYCKCSNIWIKDNMAKIICQCVIVFALCVCGGIVVVATSKYSFSTKTDASKINYHLPESGLTDEHSKETETFSHHKVLKVGPISFS